MKTTISCFAIVVMLISCLQGCKTTNTYDEAASSEIMTALKHNESTKQDALKVLGQPDETSENADGTEIWIYNFAVREDVSSNQLSRLELIYEGDILKGTSSELMNEN